MKKLEALLTQSKKEKLFMNERGEENFTPNYTGKFFDQASGLYYFNARWYDCELGRFTTQDPARDGVNWWIYCNGNPIKYIDPDGEAVETAWDIFSLASGVASFVANVKHGNVKGALIDGLGIVADATAVVLPCIPGGAGAAIKAARATGAVSNIAGGALTIQDGIENNNNLEVGIGLLQIVSGAGQLKTFSNKLNVNTSSLVPNPDDPFDFDAGNYNQKALSNARNEIKNSGTISDPIIVKRLDDGKFQIQDGHHRWKAAQQMNLKTVPIEIIE